MREILFRGKRLDNGEWAIGYLFDDGIIDRKRTFVGGLVVTDAKDATSDRYEICIDFCEVDPATVGQYTGLTGKNGAKIFEGDILKFQFHDIGEQKAVVVWDERYAMFSVKPIANFQYAALRDGTVIGNIHDNPELLKEES